VFTQAEELSVLDVIDAIAHVPNLRRIGARPKDTFQGYSMNAAVTLRARIG